MADGRISDRIAWHAPYAYSKEKRDELTTLLAAGWAFRCRCERRHALALRDDLSRLALQAAIHGGLLLDDYWPGRRNWTSAWLLVFLLPVRISGSIFRRLASPIASVRYGDSN